MMNAWACVRDAARPRSTSSTSSRFFTSGGLRRPHGEAVDDLAQHARVGVHRAEPVARTVSRFVGEAARTVDAVQDYVAVTVQDVVDDLEEEAELVRERTPGRLLRLRDPRDPEREPDRRF